jgi:CubicO group peptidase (beta-lactamase class C family)
VINRVHNLTKWLFVVGLFSVTFSGAHAQNTGPDTAQPPSLVQHPEVDARLQVLDLWITERVKTLEQPGVSVAIVYDGELLWSRGYGFADLERRINATPSTVYRIGSISKIFTTIAVLQLQEAGKLRVSDAVHDHLPWFEPKNPFPEASPITIRHLLTHTSGLPFDAPGVVWNDYTLPEREDVVASLPETEIVFPPGTATYYSNFGFWIAGEVASAVSGEPIATYVDKHVLQPLGMTDTALAPSSDMPRLAVGYGPRLPGRERTPWPFTDTRFYTPAGDGASTVEDMSRLLGFFMGKTPAGKKDILKASTIRQMWAPREDATEGTQEFRIRHGGDGGGFYGGFDVAVANKLGVVVLTNCDDGDPRPYFDQIFSIIEPGIENSLRGPPDALPAHPEWDMYLGSYSWSNWRAHILVVGGELFLVDPTEDDPWDSKIRLEAAGRHTFRMIEVLPRYGELMRFDVTSDGKVIGIRFPSSYLLRD